MSDAADVVEEIKTHRALAGHLSIYAEPAPTLLEWVFRCFVCDKEWIVPMEAIYKSNDAVFSRLMSSSDGRDAIARGEYEQ